MLTKNQLTSLLAPFEIRLASDQQSQLLAYFELLLKWNRTINLTSIRSPADCVTRHFGESLYLARWVDLQGSLLDIGSGAGFPGLALKIVFPPLAMTLLEPVAKKRAFLKEVSRACGMDAIDVRGERLEAFTGPTAAFDAATSRAVGGLERLVPLATRLLKPEGRLALWLTSDQGKRLTRIEPNIEWGAPIPLPLGRKRAIWLGRRRGRTAGS